ncbi:MAG: hypothetical protein WDA71_09665 [Actinomycetota bacterium]
MKRLVAILVALAFGISPSFANGPGGAKAASVSRFSSNAAPASAISPSFSNAPDGAKAASVSKFSGNTGPLDTESDLEAALWYEQRMLDHFHYGQVYEQIYNTAERKTGDILQLVGEQDSALYTGSYLAAQAYRYAIAKSKLAALPGNESSHNPRRLFWNAQRDDAKDRVDAMVAQYHILINISKNWKTTFNPKIDTTKDPTQDAFIDFGGGIFQGEAGLLFRSCTPADAPWALNVGRTPGDRLYGPLPWDDGKEYYCLDATSRDAYAGTTFGLVTALDFVAGDDPEMRDMIGNDLMRMTDYTLKYLWNTPRPHGKVVIPEVFGGNDLDNFISPLFVYTPMASFNMLQVARHAAKVMGTPLQQARYEALWTEEVAAKGATLGPSMEVDAADPHNAYYKYHLHHMTAFNLVRLEPNPATRELARQAFGVMDATTGDDINALFEAITYALTGEQSRLDAAVTHHREYLEYRANNDAAEPRNQVRNSEQCGTTLECVPRDQIDIVQELPDGTEQAISTPGTEATLRAHAPLPVGLRRAADFMWQKDPTILDGGQHPNWESAAADFLLPYWMIRYYTEIAKPALAPFPEWVGPTFR